MISGAMWKVLQRGIVTSCRVWGGSVSDRARGGSVTNRARGGSVTNRARGGSVRDRGRGEVANPGVERRLEALREEGVEIHNLEELEESESDLFNLDQSYDELKREEAIHKELVSLRIVGKKFFEDRTPNYLSWGEKELIRDLHTQDPQLWTPQHIASSFPITEYGAKKLLKMTWRPATESRIARHDASVARNWKQLREGDVEGVSPAMREHILQYTQRREGMQGKGGDVLGIEGAKQGKGGAIQGIEGAKQGKGGTIQGIQGVGGEASALGEYGSIIARYERRVGEGERDKGGEVIEHKGMESVIPRSQQTGGGRVKTLEQLREEMRGAAHLTPLERLMVDSKANVVEAGREGEGETERIVEKYERMVEKYEKVRSVAKLEESITQVTSYPQRIRIPRKSLKVGATYKVNDCYYDWDGRFLYRVPGLR